MPRWTDSPSDQDFVVAITEFNAVNGYPPSRRELAGMLGLSSTSSVQHRLAILRRKGWVDYDDGKMRTLRVVVNRGKRWGEGHDRRSQEGDADAVG